MADGRATWAVGSSSSSAVWMARAEEHIGDAVRALTAGREVDWSSEAAARYRAVLDEAHLRLTLSRALVSSAHTEILRLDALAAQTRAADERSALLRTLLLATCAP